MRCVEVAVGGRGARAVPRYHLLCSVCCRTTQPAPHLDNVHVVFGTVISGAALVRQLEALPVDRNARPLQDVAVTNSKKRKQEKEEKEETDADSDQSQKKDKKKKKDKKEKKKKRRHSSASGDEEETPEAPTHPLVTTSKIDPREIPDVPTNRFLMRGGRDQDDRSDPRKDRDSVGVNNALSPRMRYREREHRSYTRSGRIIKGRGVFRAEQERSEKEHEVTKRKEIEKIHSRDAEGTTPDNHPDEKEEGECDSTLDRSQTDRVDYNALDFEEDIEHDDMSHKRKPAEKVDRRRELRRTPENRAEMLALALGVNPKHDQQSDAGSFSRDSRDSRESNRRREGLASTVGYASKLSSAVGNVSEGLAKGHHEEKSKDGYDPFSLLRSTFNRGEKKDQNNQRKEGDRREAIKARLGEKEKDKEDKRDRKTDREDKDRKQQEHKNDKDDRSRRYDNKEERTRKLSEIGDKEERVRKTSEKEDRERKTSEKEDRERKTSERDDRRRQSEKSEKEERTRKHSERDERDHRRTDRHRSERSERREKSKERVRSDKSRDNDRSKARDDDKKRRRSRTPSPAKDRSKSRDRRPSAAETREKSGERTPLDEEKKKVGQEDERNEARKELMEIVRLIKSRQRERENKASAVLAKKKRESSESDSSDSDDDKRRRRSSDRDRRRRSSSRGRHSSSERRSRRRRSRSPRRDRRDRRRSSSSR
ncbi:hypothetical protein HF086_013886 [Spodoptera exigua]|uniref:PPIase cyclophilin-type domain-containing protein n=1 Tax=Spodoptera exigua TaxID=7107 RepID=A0A922SGR6_SPOEX|nr:hypothetical protein HF086_013886 [Spodoptera exigua]